MGHRARPSAATPLIAPQFAVRICSCRRLLHSLQSGIAVPPIAPQFAVEVAAQRFVDEVRPPIRVAPGRFSISSGSPRQFAVVAQRCSSEPRE